MDIIDLTSSPPTPIREPAFSQEARTPTREKDDAEDEEDGPMAQWEKQSSDEARYGNSLWGGQPVNGIGQVLEWNPSSPWVPEGISDHGGDDGQNSPGTQWFLDDVHDLIHEPRPWDELHSEAHYKRCEMATIMDEYGVDDPSWTSYYKKTSSTAAQPTASGSKGVSVPGTPPAKAKEQIVEAKGQTGTHAYVISDGESPIGHLTVPTAKRRRLSPQSISSANLNLNSGNLSDSMSRSDVGAASLTAVATSGKPTASKGMKKRVFDDDPVVFTSSPDVVRVARNKKGKQRYDPAENSMSAATKGTKAHVLDDDPVVFTSSPDVVNIAGNKKGKQRFDPAEDSMSENWENHGRRGNDSINTSRKHRIPLEDISSDLELPDLGNIASGRSLSGTHAWPQTNAKDALEAYNANKVAPKKATKKATKKPDISRSVNEIIEAKEAEKARKQKEKERKAEDKQRADDLAKVNTLRTDKKISTPEMIIDLPAELESRLAEQVRQFLGPLDVQCTEWNSPIQNVVKWRRKVEAVYNEEMEHWEPAPRQIKSEKHVLCVMGASEFVGLAVNEEGKDLDAHVLNMKAKFDGCTIIYLIEGLTVWMRKNKNVKNRAFTQAVRNQMGQDGIGVGSSSQRAKKKTQEYIDEDMIEDTLLRLQVLHGMLIHHTAATIETAEWVAMFTQHISTIPYRQAGLALNTSFCMAAGQVSTGINTSDTFLKMLQEINRITAPISYGVANEYDSATKLVRGFEAHGKDMLMDVKKSANKDGVVSDRTIGKSISRRLYAIFMGTDEGSYDV